MTPNAVTRFCKQKQVGGKTFLKKKKKINILNLCLHSTECYNKMDMPCLIKSESNKGDETPYLQNSKDQLFPLIFLVY